MSIPHRQTRLFGASIMSYGLNLGWNTQVSSLSVQLVEDPSNQTTKISYTSFDAAGIMTINLDGVEDTSPDAFVPPVIGSPVLFKMEGFEFGGILQSWKQRNSTGGNPTYEVNITDPREIIDGTQIIIDQYNGQTHGVPNLFNVYGYWENQEYGSSQVNETGMPWYKFIAGVNGLISSAVSSYGATIKFKGKSYGLDLTQLPIPPNTYRVSGGFTVGLQDAISKLCEDSSCDYFVRLLFTSLGPVIKYYTVSRRYQPALTRIQAYLNSCDDAMAKDRGLELRNEYTSAFLIGEQIHQLYTTNATFNGRTTARDAQTALTDMGYPASYTAAMFSTEGSDEDNDIWPYWGTDYLGNAVIGNGIRTKEFVTTGEEQVLVNKSIKDHIFKIDLRLFPFLADALKSDEYFCGTEELRAALIGEGAWMNHVSLYKAEHPIIKKLKISNYSKVNAKFKQLLDDARNNPPADGRPVINIEAIKNAIQADQELMAEIVNDPDKNINKARRQNFYQMIHSYASTYFGRQFMVRVPQVDVKYDNEDGAVSYSYEPADAAFLSEDDWNAGNYPLGLAAQSAVFFQPSADGRYECFVRFDFAEKYDLQGWSMDDYVVQEYSGRQVLFVKASVASNFVFVNAATYSNPRVVISLPQPLYTIRKQGEPDGVNEAFDVLLRILSDFADAGADEWKLKVDDATQIQKILQKVGTTKFSMNPLPAFPLYAAIPLRSNVLTYGPWYSSGAQGKVRAETDTTLSPWNFNGYTNMNIAAQTKVADVLSSMQTAEVGSIQRPGVPSANIGDALIIGGPIVTNIDVQDGADGVTTTYRMQTYTVNPYGFAKSRVDSYMRYVQGMNNIRNNSKGQLRIAGINAMSQGNRDYWGKQLAGTKPAQSPHDYLFGCVGAENGDATAKRVSEVSTRTGEECMPEIDASAEGTDYTSMAMMSADGIFRPFTTDVDNTDSLLSKFETPTSSALEPTAKKLNPFFSYPSGTAVLETDIAKASWGTTYPQEGMWLKSDAVIAAATKLQGIGLRAPLVLVGWGYDTNGKPVPNATPESPGTDFLDDYRNRSDKWKAGPLDARWDNDRKVWVAGGSDVKEGLLKEALIPSGTATLGVYNITSGVWSYVISGDITVTDRAGLLVASGQYLMAQKINGEYRPIIAGCG